MTRPDPARPTGEAPAADSSSKPETSRITRGEVETQSVAQADSRPSQLTGRTPLPISLGRYTLTQMLGAGGMGTVFLADDTVLKRKVALKVPQFDAAAGDDAQRRFRQEAELAAGLSHPNVCQVYDAGMHPDENLGDVHYIAMEYVEGQDLSAFVTADRLLPRRQAVGLMLKIARAVGAAHALGLVHRDLKPSNVMLCRPDPTRKVVEPKVMDFGLAKSVTGATEEITKSGVIVGTPKYMSKEQWSADPNTLGPASDVYSLGVILYELLCGRPPYDVEPGEPPMGWFVKLVTDGPIPLCERLPDVDADLAALVMRSLSAEPEDRPANAAEFASELDGWRQATKRTTPETPSQAVGGSRQVSASATAADASLELRSLPGLPSASASRTRGRRGSRTKRRQRSKYVWGGAAALLALVCGLMLTVKTKAGTVTIESDQADITVAVDDAPADVTNVTLSREGRTLVTFVAKAGLRKLEIRKDGFRVWSRELDVDTGNDRILSVSLTPLEKPEPTPPDVPVASESDPPLASAAPPIPETAPTSSAGPEWISLVADGRFSDELTGPLRGFDVTSDGTLVNRAPADQILLGTADLTDFQARIEYRVNSEIAQRYKRVPQGKSYGMFGTLVFRTPVGVGRAAGYSVGLTNNAKWCANINNLFHYVHTSTTSSFRHETHQPVDVPFDEWQAVEVTAVGDLIVVSHNGEVLHRLRDSRYPSGRLGFWTNEAGFDIRTLKYRTIDSEEAARLEQTLAPQPTPLPTDEFDRKPWKAVFSDGTLAEDARNDAKHPLTVDAAGHLVDGDPQSNLLLMTKHLRNFRARLEYRAANNSAGDLGAFVFRVDESERYGKPTTGYTVGLTSPANNTYDIRRSYLWMQDFARGTTRVYEADGPASVAWDQWHTLEVTAVGSRIVVELDGQVIHDFEDDTFARGALGLLTKDAGLEVRTFEVQNLDPKPVKIFTTDNRATAALPDDADAWVPIFADGKIGPGAVNDPWGRYVVEDNLLVEHDQKSNLIFGPDKLSDFRLRIRYRATRPDADKTDRLGALVFRMSDNKRRSREFGYSVGLSSPAEWVYDANKLYHFEYMSSRSKAVYEHQPGAKLAQDGELHVMEVTAVGDRITVVLDGRELYTVRDGKYASGYVGLHTHHPGLQVERLEYQKIE